MAIHVQIGKLSRKSVLRCFEISLYICALCAGPYPPTGVCGLLESSFIVTAQGSFPLLNLIELLGQAFLHGMNSPMVIFPRMCRSDVALFCCKI